MPYLLSFLHLVLLLQVMTGILLIVETPSLLFIGLLGMVVWAHHMFTVTLDIDTRGYFTLATIIIALPTGVKIFSWLSILNTVPLYWSALFLYVKGFLFLLLQESLPIPFSA